MSTILATDALMVQRGTTIYRIHNTTADMAKLLDTDLLLVNRAGVDYKVTYKEWKDSQETPPVIAGVTLSDSPEAGRFTSGTFRTAVTMALDGKPASSKGLKAWVEGTFATRLTSSAIVSATASTMSQPTWSAHAVTDSGNFYSGTFAAMFNADLTDSAYMVSAGYAGVAHYFKFDFSGLSYTVMGLQLHLRTTNGGGVYETNTNGEGWKKFDQDALGAAEITVTLVPATTKVTTFEWRQTNTSNLGGTYFHYWMDGSGFKLIDGQTYPTTTLTLADATGLASFTPGTAVTESGGGNDALGVVGKVDAAAKTITLSSSTGTWDPGSIVQGPVAIATAPATTDLITAIKSLSLTAASKVLANGSQANPWKTKTKPPAATGGGSGLASWTAAESPFTVTFPTPLTGVKSLVVYAGTYSNAPVALTVKVKIQGESDMTLTKSSGSSNWLYDYTFDVTGKAVLGLELVDASSYGQLAGVYLDGVQLTDAAAGVELTLASSTELDGITAGTAVSQDDKAATGTATAVNVAAKTVTLGATTGTWAVNKRITYSKPVKTRLYTVHNAAGAVSSLSSADPGFVVMTGVSPFTLTFPAVLPSGKAPDVDIPAGATITTEVQAVNSAATVAMTSNTVKPA